jgi:hypothetical protein
MAMAIQTPNEQMKIEADPTKEFFIFTLTKDIDLKRAIADLVDMPDASSRNASRTCAI